VGGEVLRRQREVAAVIEKHVPLSFLHVVRRLSSARTARHSIRKPVRKALRRALRKVPQKSIVPCRATVPRQAGEVVTHAPPRLVLTLTASHFYDLSECFKRLLKTAEAG
jgi:hypothetical protein